MAKDQPKTPPLNFGDLLSIIQGRAALFARMIHEQQAMQINVAAYIQHLEETIQWLDQFQTAQAAIAAQAPPQDSEQGKRPN